MTARGRAAELLALSLAPSGFAQNPMKPRGDELPLAAAERIVDAILEAMDEHVADVAFQAIKTALDEQVADWTKALTEGTRRAAYEVMQDHLGRLHG